LGGHKYGGFSQSAGGSDASGASHPKGPTQRGRPNNMGFKSSPIWGSEPIPAFPSTRRQQPQILHGQIQTSQPPLVPRSRQLWSYLQNIPRQVPKSNARGQANWQVGFPNFPPKQASFPNFRGFQPNSRAGPKKPIHSSILQLTPEDIWDHFFKPFQAGHPRHPRSFPQRDWDHSFPILPKLGKLGPSARRGVRQVHFSHSNCFSNISNKFGPWVEILGFKRVFCSYQLENRGKRFTRAP